MSRFLLAIYVAFKTFGFFESANAFTASAEPFTVPQDSVSLRQELYNGRVWRDIYSHRVTGLQFLFTDQFLPGTVIMNGRLFKDLKVRYDTYNDEVMIITDKLAILRLNTEKVDAFTISYDNTLHTFNRLEPDNLNQVKGYVDVLYKGQTALYVKYVNEISRLAQGRTYDVFINSYSIWVLKDGVLIKISGNKDFIRLLSDHNQEIRSYIKANRIVLSKKNPESYARVIKFYDSLSH